jgi:hypothetical protein
VFHLVFIISVFPKDLLLAVFWVSVKMFNGVVLRVLAVSEKSWFGVGGFWASGIVGGVFVMQKGEISLLERVGTVN